MNEPTQNPNSKLSARRRLVVRGAFAAPAALTLYSGSVAARSIRNCVTKQVGNPDLAPGPVSGADTYVRVRLQKFKNNNKVSRWVKGDDVAALQAPGQMVFLTTGQWYLYDRASSSNYSASPLGSIISTTPNEGTVTAQTADQWVALRVNANGDIVGVVGINNQPSTSAVHQSCWTSFRLG